MAHRLAVCSLLTALSLAFPSSIAAYDKNDNVLNSNTIDTILAATVHVTVAEMVPCSSVSFYELKSEEECPAGEERAKIHLGSGVVLQSNLGSHYVLTADHVLPEEGKNFHVLVNHAKAYVVKRDARKDLALLLIPSGEENENDSLTSFKDCVAGTLSLGDFVLSAAYLSGKKSLTDGRIHSIPQPGFNHISGPINPGNSGGAVYVLDAGKLYLAGIIVTKNEELSLGGFVGSDILREFLRDTAVGSYVNCDAKKK